MFGTRAQDAKANLSRTEDQGVILKRRRCTMLGVSAAQLIGSLMGCRNHGSKRRFCDRVRELSVQFGQRCSAIEIGFRSLLIISGLHLGLHTRALSKTLIFGWPVVQTVAKWETLFHKSFMH
jgi:hypothetical protein